MLQIIVAGVCLAGLIALGLIVARTYLDDQAVDAGSKPTVTPERSPAPPIPNRQVVIHVSEKQILQEARKLAQEIEQYLAEQTR